MKPLDTQIADYQDASAEPGVWRYARASRVRVIVDGEDYFELIQQAMLKARSRVLLIGWDFDTRIHLSRGRRWWQAGWVRLYPARLGSFILWLVRHQPQLEVRILKWSYGFLSFFRRGSMLLDLIRWFPHRRIDIKFDTAHPVGCAQHQKIVVIDDALAVCGGIDLTSGRWDTTAHLEFDPNRRRPGGSTYGPWHDLTMMMEGDVARALELHGRARWVRGGGKVLAPAAHAEQSAWPDGLEPHFENVEVGIARGRPAYGSDPAVDEVEQLFVAQIAAARRFIYAESQYFASRSIAEAIAQRLCQPDPPEVVIVHPHAAEGWAEQVAMDPARAELVAAIREIDKGGRFHLYVPYSGETPIYVHAKLLIVDDRVLRVGSANFNNRSMGLDSECDVFIDCARPGNDHAEPAIRAIRESLLAEHLGITPGDVAELARHNDTLAGLIAAAGDRNRRHLRPFHPADPGDFARDMARRETLDPEEPGDIFALGSPKRGLFRPGSLLARARARLQRRHRRRDE
ncbi:MAG: phospholipase [Erythrobacter sp.]|nr:phospholipase [Erythrobacter sp.]